MNEQYVTKEEAFSIIAQASTEQKQLYIFLLWYTGGRSTEVADLKPESIGKNYVVIPNLKQHEEVTPYKQVIIPRKLADMLRDFIERNGIKRGHYLFSSAHNRFRPWTHWTTHSIVKKAAKLAGVYKVNRNNDIVPAWPHTFRHGQATNAMKETHNLLLVQHQLGHKSLKSTEVYLHIAEADIEENVEKMAEGDME